MENIWKTLAQEATAVETSARPKSKRKTYEYIIEASSYPDLVIKKEEARSTKQLVILFSQGTAFIKTTPKGKEAYSETLSPESYTKYMQGLDGELPLPDGFWCKSLKRGLEFGRLLCLYLNDEHRADLIRFKLVDDIEKINWRIDQALRAFDTVPELMKEFRDDKKVSRLLVENYAFVSEVATRFGLENARDFLREYSISLLEIYSEFRSRSVRWARSFESAAEHDGYDQIILPYTKMEYKAFKNFFLYASVRDGYARNAHEFLNEWIDTLEMQYQVYGKIKEKYPDSLPTLHNQLSYKSSLVKERIDEQKFKTASEKAKIFEGTKDGFVFIAPKTKQDFYDEATAQQNCLASYVNRFAEQKSVILFMRKKESPEASYITVEVCDGEIRQALYSRNRHIQPNEMLILRKWVSRCLEKKAA